MKTKKRIFAIFMSVCLVLSVLPATVMGESETNNNGYTPFSDLPVMYMTDKSGNTIMYYDVYGNNERKLDNEEAFLKQVMGTKVKNDISSELLPLYNHWDNLAGIVIGGNSDLNNLINDKDWDIYSEGATDSHNWQNVSGGIKFARKISDIKDDIMTLTYGYDNVKAGDYAYTDNFQQPIQDQPMLYSVNRAILKEKKEGKEIPEFNISYANIYYDFKLSYMNTAGESVTGLPEEYESIEDLLGSPGFTYQSGTPEKTYSTGVQNLSTQIVNTEQKYTIGSTNTVGNEVSQSLSLGFEEMIGVESTISAKFPVLNLGISTTYKFQFTASQTIGSSQSKSESNSKTESVDSSISVSLPAHTEVLLEQSRGINSMTIDYDYPVAITYKVKTIGVWGAPEEKATRTMNELATFGRNDVAEQSNAVDNLNTRWGSDEREKAYGDGISWTNSIANINLSEKNWLKMLSNYVYINDSEINGGYSGAQTFYVLNKFRPMSIAGGTLSASSEGFSSKVYDIVPMYALNKITLDDQSTYQLNEGDVLNVDKIDIQGLNTSNVPYYGFDSDKGSWVLLDSSGNEITQSAIDINGDTVYQNDIAALVTDKNSGVTYLKAKDVDGKVYLKYKINEWKDSNGNVRSPYTYSNSNVYTTNDKLSKTAVATINIKSAPKPLPALSKSQLNYDLSSKTYNGSEQGVKVTSKDGAGKVSNVYYTGTGGTNYPKSTVKPTNAGYYTVTADVDAGSGYDGTKNLVLGTFKINKASLSKVKIDIPDKTWNGKQVKPKSFKYEGKWYTVSSNASLEEYGGNKNIGTGKITLVGKGNFTGKKTIKFKIIPKKNSIKKIKSGKKKMTVSWKKASAAQKITAYQIRYRQSGKSKWKTKTVKATAGSVTIKKLKSKKKYQVQVRSYKKVSGKKYYSAWSNVKTSKKIK